MTPTKSSAGDDHLLVGSVVKAIQVLEAYDGVRRYMGFSEIARVTGLERSAAQRAAHTLWRLGYLDKAPGSGEYRLSIRCLDLGLRFVEAQRIIERATPYITLLRRKTTGSVNIAMLDGTETVLVQRQTTPEMQGNRLGARARIPAYCTATGIAMMSHLPDDKVDEILARSDLKPIMPNTVWQPSKIKERIAEARARKFALGVEEDMSSDITVACGLVDHVTKDVAAIGVSYISESITLEEALAQSRDLLLSVVSSLATDLQT
ncbi:MAG: IclR family transcriptional regulator [Rhizobiales bacterium]|nr:IclR family transcriptional regulator [Hyphomicrobiales bacterium]